MLFLVKLPSRRRMLTTGALLLGWAFSVHAVDTEETAEAEDIAEPVSEAVGWLQEYLRIDTTNPPGNEAEAVEFLAKILEANGIRYRVAEPEPGRKNLWARLDGGDEPGLLLVHHSDDVSADPDFWDTDPFGAEIIDGHIYGRGALDMKSQGIVHLATFIGLHRNNVKLNRDVVFMATADEEAGSDVGMGWMIRNRPAAFSDIGLALTEGGQATLVRGRIALGIEVTQKVPLWLRLETTGPAGHGSTPRTQSALGSLIDALARLREHDFEPRIVPAVDTYFKRLAPNFPGKFGAALADIEASVQTPAFRRQLQGMMPNLSALTKNTCAITRVSGSDKINVVGPIAAAEIDCRLLPDQEPIRFLAEVQRALADDSIWIHPLLTFRSSVSDTDTELFAAIATVMDRHFPGVAAVPTVSAGFTDSHYLRERGIASYGFAPFVVPVDDTAGYHGNNERISVENVDRGVDLLTEIVMEVASSK